MEPLDPKRFNIRYTFEYPYPKWSEMNTRDLKQIYYNTTPEVKKSIQRDIATANELARLDEIDRVIDTMTAYPLAKQLLERFL